MNGHELILFARVESQGSLQLLTARDLSTDNCYDCSQLSSLHSLQNRVECTLEQTINQLGVESAKAQNLKAPITSFQRLLNGSFPNSPTKYSDCIYLLLTCDSNEDFSVLGFIKTGNRSLYLQRDVMLHLVADFYVRERRKGFGFLLFSQMLKFENVKAKNCAIDRPTPCMLSFLKKHFSLENPLPQHNRYVIFDGFFM
ncbi:hypothetical protein B4U80_04255 [Leptotrombidium deliense]|uniref:N-acetyltransferase domain-containing protein n=1 Tax=Leptotrombidium deliense TaxID=299467 RepID=A0A443SVF8_9ACAR|nr:hypothetical protein B4U80_04255 [Leptotrombidium deliense]